MAMAAKVLRCVFGDPKYAALALAVAAAVFIIATWLPNLSLLWEIVTSPSVPLSGKVGILIALVGSIATNFTVYSGFSLVALALLFGANAALIVYGMNQRRHLTGPVGQSGAATSLGGLAAGLTGVGCAACGTVALAPVLSLAGAGSLLAVLPFGGQEFSALGIGLLSLSLYLSGKALAKPIACPSHYATEPSGRGTATRPDEVSNFDSEEETETCH